MGMIDSNAKLATAQVVTATGDTPGTNIYDCGSAHTTSLGLSDELWIQAIVDTKATSGGAATVQAVLQHSDDGSTWKDILSGPQVPVAQMTAGAPLLQSRFPLGLKRYFRIAWRVGTAALTAGKFTAFVAAGVQNNIAYPSGFSVK